METSRRLLVPSIWSLTLVVSIVLGAYSHSIGHYRPPLTFWISAPSFPTRDFFARKQRSRSLLARGVSRAWLFDHIFTTTPFCTLLPIVLGSGATLATELSSFLPHFISLCYVFIQGWFAWFWQRTLAMRMDYRQEGDKTIEAFFLSRDGEVDVL